MSLRLALVIDGDQAGAKKALEDTASGIDKVNAAAGKASPAVTKVGDAMGTVADKGGKAAPNVASVGDALESVATEGARAAPEIDKVGTAVENAGGKFDGLKRLAIGALGGIAASIAGEGIAAATDLALGAFTKYAGEILSSGPQVEAALKRQADLVDRIKGAFNDAANGVSSYGNNSRAALLYDTQQSTTDLREAFERQQSELLSGGWFGANAIQAGQGPAGSPLQRLVADFRAELRDGEADVIAFRNAVAEMALALPADDPSQQYAKALLEDTAPLAEVQQQLMATIDLYRGLKGDAEAMATAIGGSTESIAAQNSAIDQALPGLREYLQIYRDIAATGVVAPGAEPVTAPTTGFAAGGWTGGVRHQVRGVVHGEEFVVRAGPAARHFDLLEAINNEGAVPGHAAGGFVGTAPALGSVRKRGEAAEVFSVIDDLTDSLSALDGAATQFLQGLVRTRDPLAAFGSVLSSVSQRFLNSAIGAVGNLADRAIGDLFGNLFGATFGTSPAGLTAGGPGFLGGGADVWAGIGHAGATIGASTGRFVPASLFDNAPRHHAGTDRLRPGEVPFIGMEGEEIGWPDQLAKKYGGNTTVNYWNIETPNPRSFAESRASVARAAGRLSGSAWRHS